MEFYGLKTNLHINIKCFGFVVTLHILIFCMPLCSIQSLFYHPFFVHCWAPSRRRRCHCCRSLGSLSQSDCYYSQFSNQQQRQGRECSKPPALALSYTRKAHYHYCLCCLLVRHGSKAQHPSRSPVESDERPCTALYTDRVEASSLGQAAA